MQLTDVSWSDVDKLPRQMPVLIPIAALEQHGNHMPVFTDSLLLGEVIRRVRPSLEDRVLFAPLMWLGNSEHHLDFPGTMTASPRGYLDLLRDLAENFLFHGFQRIVFLNGHGGNIVPSQQAVFELRQKYRERHDLLLLASTYWTLGGKPHEINNDIMQTHMGHACEWETSMMLRIRPELVQNLDQVEPVEFGDPFLPASRGWITKDRSPAGHIGDPRHATAEKGETIFTAFAADVINMMERVIHWDGQSWSG
jgi:creatinine amidohydrolase